MDTAVSTPAKAKSRAKSGLAVNDRVAITGRVLRIIGGGERSVLILVDANAQKIIIKAHWFADGDKLHGGAAVTLRATVTRLG